METNDKPKRKYAKHKEGYKVTVKHYIHDRVQVELANQEIHSPLYIQVIALQKSIFFKSKIDTMQASREDLLNWITYDEHGKKVIERERDNITKITQQLMVFPPFSAANIANEYKNLSEFSELLRLRLTEILCAQYDMQFGKDHQKSSFDEFQGIHPLVLLHQWRNVPAVASVNSRFSEHLWDFDFYYGHFRNSADRKVYVFALLEPNMYDFDGGYLEAEMKQFYSSEAEKLDMMFSDIKEIMRSIIL